MTWLFIFHRDLRIIDNNTLETLHGNIIPAFIFTPEQVDKNKYKSTNAIQFMLESLEDLDTELRRRNSKLHCFHDTIENVLNSLPSTITGIADGIDYTPYAYERTQRIRNWCRTHGKEYRQEHDIYIHPPGTILNKSGKPYQKFTPFYETSLQIPVKPPRKNTSLTFTKSPLHGQVSLAEMWKHLVPVVNSNLHVHGGRTRALQLLSELPDVLRTYEDAKDYPTMRTSWLSAHNHFGTISIREVYSAAKSYPAFIRQLYWRDFYGHVIAAFENLYGVSPYDFTGKRKWREGAAADADFRAWCNGRTGVDIVDAGMQQLNKTGYIPNRVRLIVGSYLVNELGISWKKGEEYFSRHLVDVDYAQNMGNWSWLDGSTPYGQNPLRIMSVTRQEQKFDPRGEYSSDWLGVRAGGNDN